MGLEARCQIRYRTADGDERTGEGAVHLDDAELVARGEARHRIPRASIRDVTARGDALVVTHASGITTLALGPVASMRWAARLAAPPKEVLAKLGVKPGLTVSAVNVADEALLADIASLAGALTREAVATGSDIALLGIMKASDLARIARAEPLLAPGGCIWALHPRGVPEVADTKIFETAKGCGMTYTKVARVSEQLSGEKLVRRKG